MATKKIIIEFMKDWESYRITYLDENEIDYMRTTGLNEEQVLCELNNNLGGLE